MAETLQTLSFISFAVAGVCFVLAIFFWFFFKVPTVIGDLSGRTARKSIAMMRVANEKNGAKFYKESKNNAERGKLIGTMTDFGKTKKKKDVSDDSNPETSLLSENKVHSIESEETALLDEITDIHGSETTGLLIDENATVPLDSPDYNQAGRVVGKKLELIEEVMLIHTNEIIQ